MAGREAVSFSLSTSPVSFAHKWQIHHLFLTRPTRRRVGLSTGIIKQRLLGVRAQNLLLSRVVWLRHHNRRVLWLCTILNPSLELREESLRLSTVTTPAVSETRNAVVLVEGGDVADKLGHLLVVA